MLTQRGLHPTLHIFLFLHNCFPKLKTETICYITQTLASRDLLAVTKLDAYLELKRDILLLYTFNPQFGLRPGTEPKTELSVGYFVEWYRQ